MSPKEVDYGRSDYGSGPVKVHFKGPSLGAMIRQMRSNEAREKARASKGWRKFYVDEFTIWVHGRRAALATFWRTLHETVSQG